MTVPAGRARYDDGWQPRAVRRIAERPPPSAARRRSVLRVRPGARDLARISVGVRLPYPVRADEARGGSGSGRRPGRRP
ncbi:hypothetical protein LUR56_12410 [Streptomyces sp. MT29]|nr:hypothetical protein [Streptomyces sp. MT29]